MDTGMRKTTVFDERPAQPKSVTIDPQFAQEILNEYAFYRQRPVYPHHVKMLAGIMQSGQWLADDQLTFCETSDKRLFLVNGYHRLHAVKEYGRPIRFSTRILKVRDEQDVATAYATFDTMARKRSEGEIIHGMGVLETYGLSKGVAAAVYRAAAYLANGLRAFNYQTAPDSSRNVLNRLIQAGEYWNYGKKYQDMIQGAALKHKARMLVAPVVAVAIVTIRHQFSKASEFWPAVATMSNLSNGDPRLTLAKYLDDRRYNGAAPDGTYHPASVDCSLAWNAFFERRKINILRNASAFRLAGTPWR